MLLRSLLSPAVLMIVAMLAGSGCHGTVVYYDDGYAVKKRHVHRHVCADTCHDCYYDGSRLIVLKGHRHGPGCGHVWNGRHWVVGHGAPVKKRVGHYTKGRPDRYWDGKRYVVIKGHKHGPGCGHVWDGKHWVVSGKKKSPSKTKANVKAKGERKAKDKRNAKGKSRARKGSQKKTDSRP